MRLRLRGHGSISNLLTHRGLGVCVVWKVGKNSMDEDIGQVLRHRRENLEETVSGLKMKLARSAEEHDRVYVKLMKVKRGRESSAAATDPSPDSCKR